MDDTGGSSHEWAYTSGAAEYQAQDLLRDLPRVADHVFPSDHRYPGKVLRHGTLSRWMLKAVEGMGCEPFRVHDFRRTFVTLMAEDEELDANPAVLDAMLNQKVTGVADVYNRVRYLKQSRRYWQYWADQLQKWEGPILKVVAEHG